MRAMIGVILVLLFTMFSADGAENPWKLVQADSTGETNLVNLTNLTFKGTSTYTNGSGLLGTDNETIDMPVVSVIGAYNMGLAGNSNNTKMVWCVGSASNVFTTTDAGTNWVVRIASNDLYWAASSADGSILAVTRNVAASTLIFSYDSGVTWETHSPTSQWVAVEMSHDGMKMVASSFTSNIFTSVDAGTNWTARDQIRQWYFVASSADGSKLYATVYGVGVYRSTDSGVNWVACSLPVNNYSGIACSDDGSVVTVVLTGTGDYLCTSYDYGVTWKQRIRSAGDCYKITMSSDGRVQVSPVHLVNLVDVSTDYGKTWTPYANAANNCLGVDLTDDGTRCDISAGNYGPYPYYFELDGTKSEVNKFNVVEAQNYYVVVWYTDPNVVLVSDAGSMSETAAIGRYIKVGSWWYKDGDVASYVMGDPMGWGNYTLTDAGETGAYFDYVSIGYTIPCMLTEAFTWTGSCLVQYERRFVTNLVADVYGVNSDFIQGINATNWIQGETDSSSWTNWKALHPGVLTNSLIWTYADSGTNWGPMLSAPSTITRITSQAYSGGMTATVLIKHWTNDWGNATVTGTMPCVMSPQQSNWSWAVPATTEVGVVFGDGAVTQKVIFGIEVVQ